MLHISEMWITDDVKHFVILGTVPLANKPPGLLKSELADLKKDITSSEFCKECEENGVKFSIFVSVEDEAISDETLEQLKKLIESKENSEELSVSDSSVE